MAATESGRVQVVYTANVGSPLAADVAPGASVITVDDTSDFDTDGTLQVAGQTVGYTAVDDDTGVVTLAATVTGAAEAGDIVTLWDTGLDQAAVEYRAHVALPGVLDNADAVDATIRHTLIAYLEEGIRNPGTGESVRMERHGLDWVIVDLLGKQPSVAGGGNVVTGSQTDPTDVSITATLAGPGSSSADGADSIAIGDAAQAVTANSVAIGPNSTAGDNTDSTTLANSEDTIAVGKTAGSYATRGVAIGRQAIIGEAGYDGIAIGYQAQVSGSDGIAIGSQNPVASGIGGVALGANAIAARDFCVAVGENAFAGGLTGSVNSVAIGRTATATGDQAVAIGGGVAAVGDYDFVLGTSSHKVKVAGRLNVAQRTPSSSADTQGAVGDITSDIDYLYVKTSAGWKRVALSTFGAGAGPVAATGTASMSLAATATVAAGPAAATGTASMTLAATATTPPVAATGTASMSLAAAAAAAVYDAAVLADSPLVYWKLDETSGTTMTDSSGNAHNGTYSGATLNQAPLVNDGGRSALGGAGGQGIGSLASAAWMEQNTFTVECWVKPNNTVAGGKSFFSRFTSGNMNWAMYQDTGKLRFLLNSTEATGPTYTVGAIYHLVGTYDGTNLRLYVNGSLFATAATTQSGASSQNMQVGGHGGGSYSQATVDGVAFYAGALSATRVAAHYAAGI